MGANGRTYSSISLSADGRRLLLGDPKNDDSVLNGGYVELFEWSGSEWIRQGQVIYGDTGNNVLGWSVSMNGQGDQCFRFLVY